MSILGISLAASLHGGGVALFVAAPPLQAEPTREALPRASISIHVIDDATGVPVAGASVTMVPVAMLDAECARRWGSLQCWFDRYELDEVTLQSGTTKRSGENGEVEFERPTGGVRLIATTPDRFAAIRVADAEPAVATLRMHADVCVDFHVVDEHGEPVGGIPVAIGWGMDEPIDTAWPASFDGAVVSRASDGVAHFPHAGEWLAPEAESSELAVLAFPVANRVEVRFGSAAANVRRELVVPPLGRVVLSFPGVGRGVAQLRNDAVRERGGRPFWRDFEPARAAIVDGKATFPFVGVGTKLQYRATWEGLSAPEEGLFVGPQRAGDTIEFEAPGADATPHFVARFLDEDGRPLGGAELYVGVQRITEDGSESEGFHLTADAEGRTRFTLTPRETAEDARLVLEIGVSDDGSTASGRPAAVSLELPQPLTPGVHDLGDLPLHVPGSRKHLRTISDEKLEHLFLDARAGHPFTSDAVHDADTCLFEIVERGGKHWEKLLERLIAASTKRENESFHEDDGEISDLRTLIALRRMQRKPEPIALEVEGAPRIEAVFPDDPLIRYLVKNVDEDGATLALMTYELPKSGMNEYCHVEVRTGRGDVVPHHEQWFIGGGVGFRVTIPPTEARSSSVALEYFLQLPAAGDYRARLFHGFGNSCFASVSNPNANWICAKSDEFTIRVLPRPIDLPVRERARLRERFDAIDFEQPVVVDWRGRWKADDEYEGDVASPEDELYRAGWRSVPVLLDVLEDAHASPRARAWALALLVDITGLFGDEHEERSDALGRHRTAYDWPTVHRERWQRSEEDSLARVDGPPQPDVALQAPLIRSWLAIRGSLAIRE